MILKIAVSRYCDVCKDEVTVQWQTEYSDDNDKNKLNLLENWHFIDGQAICPKHEVKRQIVYFVDGKEFYRRQFGQSG